LNPLAYIPEGHQQFQKEEIISDLNVDEILLLQDGHLQRRYTKFMQNNPKMDLTTFK
jgi:hypothetical protein